MKKARASWLGKNVVVFERKTGTLSDKVLKTFVAGSKNMPENMARWAAMNNIDIVNLRRDKKTGRLMIWL